MSITIKSAVNHKGAGHHAIDCLIGTCVKFYFEEYEVSLSADGKNTIVFNKDDENLFEINGTGIKSVVACYKFIKKHKT